MAQVEITDETEQPGGWSFDAQVIDEAGGLHRCTLRLSWADYNLWSPNGADAPEKVAEAALRFFLSLQCAGKLKSNFDASLLRRLDPDADEHIHRFIGE